MDDGRRTRTTATGTARALRIGRAGPGDAPAALEVWRAANIARGRPPSAGRVARVRAELAEPDRVLLVSVDADRVVGMALLEPGLAADGAGAPVHGLGRIAMVFVAPAAQRRGVGTGLLAALVEGALADGLTRLLVWTAVDNERAVRLYRAAGFTGTGRRQEKGDRTIVQLALDVGETGGAARDRDAVGRE